MDSSNVVDPAVDQIDDSREEPNMEDNSQTTTGKRKADGPAETDGLERHQQYKRFKVTREEDAHKWSLPEELAEYANEASEQFIPDKELKEQIMFEAPRPSNLDAIKSLDETLVTILKRQNHQGYELDKTLKKIQEKVGDIMGPLSKVWKMVELVRTSGEEADLPNPEEVASAVEKSVTMVGQCLNMLTYERRKNVLTAISNVSTAQASQTLKDKASLLQMHDDDLFGKKYREHMTETNKNIKQDCMVVPPPDKPSSSSGSKKRWFNKKPFRGGPSHFKTNGGGRTEYKSRQPYYKGNSFSSIRKGSLSQQSVTATTTNRELGELGGPHSGSSGNSKSVFRPKNSKGPSGWAYKTFSSSLEKTDSGQKSVVNSPRLRNTIHFGTDSNKGASAPDIESTRKKTW